MPELKIGICEAGVMHTGIDDFDLDTKFRLVKEAGVFDYFDKTPGSDQYGLYIAAQRKHDLPMLAGGWFYMIGRDEPLLEWHLRMAKDLGQVAHNTQVFAFDADRKPVTDQQVADLYCRVAEIGEKVGVAPCFEVHVNMWSEHVGRVEKVAKLVRARGAKFNMTLDHSHVIFKIDNPTEQKIQDMDRDIATGELELDPFKPNSVTGRWIDNGYVRHAHARATVPNGPVNSWQTDAKGRPGRGIQYPFIRPKPGDWHSEWREEALEPWKEVVRQLLRHHANDPHSQLRTISTEFIPWPDYGGGARYSLFEHSVACAQWIRDEWRKAQESATARTAVSDASNR